MDLRNVDNERLDKMDAEIRAFIEKTSKESGLAIIPADDINDGAKKSVAAVAA